MGPLTYIFRKKRVWHSRVYSEIYFMHLQKAPPITKLEKFAYLSLCNQP